MLEATKEACMEIITADLMHELSCFVHDHCEDVPHDIGIKLAEIVRKHLLAERRPTMLEWKDGLPTELGDYRVQHSNGNTGYIRMQQTVLFQDIVRHYGPIPDPPVRLKLFRRFRCSCGDLHGVGFFDPNDGVEYPFKIYWGSNTNNLLEYGAKEVKNRGIEIEWEDE